jgi:hypothetical protein
MQTEEDVRGSVQLGNIFAGGRIILNCILKKQSSSVWTGFIWLRAGYSGGLL